MSSADRERDAAGRARSARPRDRLGRPLARGTAGEPTMPEGLLLPAVAAVALAQDLLDTGRPFHAHEVLESAWKADEDPGRRRAWQALAQIAVGLTHHARGNDVGAERLVRRGRDGLAAAGADIPEVDAAGVVRWADAWLAGRRTGGPRLAGLRPGGRAGPLS